MFRVHGNVGRLFRWTAGVEAPPKECLVEGPAGTGKTRGILEWCRHMSLKYPTSKGLFLRSTRVALNESVLDVWENEVLGPTHPAVLGGPSREHRSSYKHSSLGGEIVLGGMDNPTKLFSSAYNWIYFNELQEEQVKDGWESLHRALRRSGTPFTLLIGDINPVSPYFWANERCKAGMCLRIETKFHDNPKWYDHAKAEWTPAGVDYITRLSSQLSGVQRRRLYLGEWAAAEGQVWPNFDPDFHIIEASALPEIKWTFGAIDWGYTDPGCVQVWGVDAERRMYRLAEVYRTGQTFEWWAQRVFKLRQEFNCVTFVADPSRPDNIKQLNDWLSEMGDMRIVRGADNRKTARPGAKLDMVGIDLVRWGFDRDSTGKARIYLVRGALRDGPDPDLKAKGKPYCLEMEIPAYVYAVPRPGMPTQEDTDTRCFDHACDPTRYGAGFLWRKDFTPPAQAHHFPPGTYGHRMRYDELFGHRPEDDEAQFRTPWAATRGGADF